jgi:hypothetical protein
MEMQVKKIIYWLSTKQGFLLKATLRRHNNTDGNHVWILPSVLSDKSKDLETY